MTIINNLSTYKHSKRGRIVFYAAFLLVLFSVFLKAEAVKAQEDQAADFQTRRILSPEEVRAKLPQAPKSFVVEGIQVDITADNAVEARKKAFETAQIKGYEVLARRMLSPEELTDFKTPSFDKISRYVQDYEVSNERISAVRYNGTYKIRYSQRAFQKKSHSNSDVELIQQKGDLLVLPFYVTANRSFLWQANPFMQAWVRARDAGTAENVIVPVGDMKDITFVRDNQMRSYDPAKINAIRDRYKAQNVAMLSATPSMMSNGTQDINIALYNAKPYGPELMSQMTVRSFLGEGEDQLYNRLVQESQKLLTAAAPTTLQNAQTTQPIQPSVGAPEGTITAQLNFSSVREWIDTKKAIERLPSVSRVQVQSMSPRAAILNVQYRGGVQGLRDAMAQNGIGLNDPTGGQIYQLKRMTPASTVYY